MPIVVPVRMHFSTQDLWFDPKDSGAREGDHVIVTTERGTEIGLVTCDPITVDHNELHGELKPVLRVATQEDLDYAEELVEKGIEAMPQFRALIKEHELDMKPVGVEYLFGGEKIVFYFAAEERVDFRELVRGLAGAFHAHVDMRQIGVRDEARRVGGFAPCGQELCCVRFSGDFDPVSIRMAKEQDLPLNSTKISGVCGRLMCCLRYEFEAYKDFKQRAPKKNAVIETPLGKAKVVEHDTPRERLTLRLENGKSFTIGLADMTCSDACKKKAAAQKDVPAYIRPDSVTREALEALGTAEIMAQLADLDRASGVLVDNRELDSSLLERRTARKHGDSKPSGNEPKLEDAPSRTPRRKGAKDAEQAKDSARASKDSPTDPAASAEGSQQRAPRGGGMRPSRRKGRDNTGGQGEAATEQSRDQGQNQGQGSTQRQPRGQRQEGSTAQPERRARRQHKTADGNAPAAGQQEGKQDQATQQPQGSQQGQRRGRSNQQEGQQPRQRRRGNGGNGNGGANTMSNGSSRNGGGDENRSADAGAQKATQQRRGGTMDGQPASEAGSQQSRARRNHRRGEGSKPQHDAAQQDRSPRNDATQQGGSPSQGSASRPRRRPGDRGGQQSQE